MDKKLCQPAIRKISSTDRSGELLSKDLKKLEKEVEKTLRQAEQDFEEILKENGK